MALALLLTLLIPLASAALEQPFNVHNISMGVHVDRHFSISTEAPTTAALRRSPNLQRRLAPGFKLVETLGDLIDKRKASSDPLACNLRPDVVWVRATKNHIRVRQVGEVSELCNTRVSLNDAAVNGEMDPAYVEQVKDIVIDVKDALFQAQKDIPSIPDQNNPSLNWSRGAYALRDWDLKRSGQTCTSDNLFAYRKNAVWYVRAGITNRPVDAYLPEWNRQYIDEYIPKDFSDPMRLLHVKYGSDGLIEDGTTFLSRFAGKAGLASVSNMVFDDNPALIEALRLNALAVDQAEDAVTPSNIAILALPMAMSLIPVAFLADLNTCAMLWYIIFTDVFSALPFMIKGIELLDSTSIKRGGIVAYHVGNETLGQMEVWAAECRGEDSFRVLGIIFISLAVFATTFGVLLELVAAAVMRRKRANKGHEASGPFGMALFDQTAYALLGSAGDEEKNQRLSVELEREGRYSDEEASWNPQGTGAMGADDGSGEDGEEGGQGSEERRWWWARGRKNERNRQAADDSSRRVEVGVEISAQHAGSSGDEWVDCKDSSEAATTVLGGQGM